MLTAFKQAVKMSRPTFHLISDLHLEHYPAISSVSELLKLKPALYKLAEPGNTNKVLLLPGDIGSPRQESFWSFMADLGSKYKRVLYTPGNHEMYGSDMETINEICAKRAAEIPSGNVHFLQKTALYADGVRYIGATLWSNIPLEHQIYVQKSMNDYNLILRSKHTPKLIDVTDTIAVHKDHKAWLEAELERDDKTQTVVLTHHLPCEKLIAPKYGKSPINHGFFSDCESLIRAPVIGWVCGHTHTPMHIEIRGVSLRVNPMGYHTENRRGVPVSEFEL